MPAPPACFFFAVTLVALSASCGRAPSVAPPAAESAASRLIYTEQAGGVTTFWSVSPDDLGSRQALARVRHDPEWGVRASLSPDGRRIAYLAAPSGSRDPDRAATLTILDPSGRSSVRLAGGLDLRATPVWWPRERRLVVQRVDAGGLAMLVSVAYAGGDLRPLAAPQPGHRLYAIGEEASGALAVADLSADGAMLRLLSPGDAAEERVDLGAGVARAFSLSPDGGVLAYLRLESQDGTNRYRARRLTLRGGVPASVRDDVVRLEDTGVAWTADGGLLVSTITASGAGRLLGERASEDHANAGGFDALGPAAHDGHWFALRSFTGGSTAAPGSESLVALAADGRRITLSSSAVAIGWRGG